jgi:enoyl-CoA hydratase/carnithine racemase
MLFRRKFIISLKNHKYHRTIVSLHEPDDYGMGIISMDSLPVNSLTKDIFLSITDKIKQLESQPKCHSVILTSSCRVFSAGYKLLIIVINFDF